MSATNPMHGLQLLNNMVDRWVETLPAPSALTGPLQLAPEGHAAFCLTPHLSATYPEGTDVSRSIPKKYLPIGKLYFHPATRNTTGPAFPPLAELQGFINANPKLPIALDKDQDNSCERPHLVFASFVNKSKSATDKTRVYGVDKNGRPVIMLVTLLMDTYGLAFNPATHFKHGMQWDGVYVFDWTTVIYLPDFEGGTVSDIWLRVYSALRDKQ